MKISAHTLITNPDSKGYLCYLPVIQSWLDFADEVIVVDGGTTDDSISKLKKLRNSNKLIIVSNDFSYWGDDDNWEWPQIAINRQIGFELCSGDWAIHFDADYLLPEFEYNNLRELLRIKNGENALYSFKVIGNENTRYFIPKVKRKWCINKSYIINEKIDVEYGLTHSGGLDNIIIPEKRETFIDPVNKVEKEYSIGKPYLIDGGLVNIFLYRLGYFNYNSKQLQYNQQRIENALSKYLGRPSKKIAIDNRKYVLVDYNTFLKNRPHPKLFIDFLKGFSNHDVLGLRIYHNKLSKRLNLYFKSLYLKFILLLR